MLEIIQMITIIITALVVGVAWGMFIILKREGYNITKYTNIQMAISTLLWCSGVIIMFYDICKYVIGMMEFILIVSIGFVFGMAITAMIISAYCLTGFNVDEIRKLENRKSNLNWIIRQTNTMIEFIAKDKEYTASNYHIGYTKLCNQIGTNTVNKFAQYYINKGFKVYLAGDILYISWEEDDVSGSDDNK